MRKTLLLFSLILSLNGWGNEQPDDIIYSRTPLMFGVEQDVLPYFLKGYIVTGWIGSGFFRKRFSYAQASSPGFFLQDGISSDRVKAFGLSFEYFFRENFEGFWFGPGIGYWTNDIQAENGLKQKNESFIFTLGGGYNYSLTKWLYVSPWLALHTRVSGTDEFNIGAVTTYKPILFTPELSVKIGIKLGRYI